MKWEKFNLGKSMPDDLLETAHNGDYGFQAEIIKKVHIFGEKLFGDFDVRLRVFDKNSNQIDMKEFKGMNGSFTGAKNLLKKCKEEMTNKYNQVERVS